MSRAGNHVAGISSEEKAAIGQDPVHMTESVHQSQKKKRLTDAKRQAREHMESVANAGKHVTSDKRGKAGNQTPR